MQTTIERVQLDSIRQGLLPNIRSDMDPVQIENLAYDIIANGLLQYPAVKRFVEPNGAGEEVDVFGIAWGNRRVAALYRAREILTAHNERAAVDNGFADVGEEYRLPHEFIDVDSETFFNNFTECPVFVLDADTSVVEADLAELQLRENGLRADINLVDKMIAVVALLDGGRTQSVVAAMINATQGLVSQYRKMVKQTIPEILDALRAGKITTKDALGIADLVLGTPPQPDRDAQLFTLEQILSPSSSGSDGPRARTIGDLRKLRVSLVDQTQFASADTTRRRIIQEVLAWVDTPELSETDLLNPPEAGINIDANMPDIPVAKAPKEPKPPKEPKAPKAAKGTKAPPAAAKTAATSASAPPAAARPLLNRPVLKKK